jgi:hypothetical protein
MKESRPPHTPRPREDAEEEINLMKEIESFMLGDDASAAGDRTADDDVQARLAEARKRRRSPPNAEPARGGVAQGA